MVDKSHKGPESAANCYAEMSMGRAETPEYQLMSFGDRKESSARPKGDGKTGGVDGPFGGKKPQS